MTQLNINTYASEVYARRLEQINRSAFPVSVRQALNKAAFDVKKETLPKSAERNFIKRSPNFFKSFSGVTKATGFNISSMKAEVGMIDKGKSSARTAIRNMEIQEKGGSISEGADYLAAARGGNNRKRVTRSNYFDKSKMVTGPFKRAVKKKSKFVASAFVSLKEKKRMSFFGASGRFTMQVTSIKRLKNGGVKINSRLLMKDRTGKPVKIKATHFAKEAAEMTSRKIEGFFLEEAEKQFKRVLGR